jgi:hypothetical protein
LDGLLGDGTPRRILKLTDPQGMRMFVAQHSARSRLARAAFLAVGLLPCALVVAWAGWRHSWGHREAFRRGLESRLGMAVSLGGIEHLRPGCTKLFHVVIGERDGRRCAVPSIEIETSPTEIRLRTATLECTPAAAAMLAALARDWLERPVRYERHVVIDAGEFCFPADAMPGDSPPTADTKGGGVGLHVECVTTPLGRALRLCTEPASEDEIVIRFLDDSPDRVPAIEVRGCWTRPVPVTLLAAILDLPSLTRVCGTASLLGGSIDVRRGDDGWSGSLTADLAAVDLGSITRDLSLRLDGSARLTLSEVRFDGDRLTRLAARISGGPGAIAADSLVALVRTLGCRPGNAFGATRAGGAVRFDHLAAAVTIDASGLTIDASTGPGLLAVGGVGLIEAPLGPVGIDRVVQALSPVTPLVVPATTVSGWLLAMLPLPPSGPATAHPPAGEAVGPPPSLRR